jgi:hypothetical protein
MVLTEFFKGYLMSQTRLTNVVQLADTLTVEEQHALIVHLQDVAKRRQLTDDEWWYLLRSIQIDIPPGPLFSDRRQDWYDDDGR